MKVSILIFFSAIIMMSILITNCSENIPTKPKPEVNLASLHGRIQGDGILVYSDPISGARITLIAQDSSIMHTTSDGNGEFIFDSLYIGKYRIEITKEIYFYNNLLLVDSININDVRTLIDTFYFSSIDNDYFPIDSGYVWKYKGRTEFWPTEGGIYSDSVILKINVLGKNKVGDSFVYPSTEEKTVFWSRVQFGYVNGNYVEDTSFYTNNFSVSEGNFIEKEGLVYNFFFPGFHAYPKNNQFFRQVFDIPDGGYSWSYGSGNLFSYKGHTYYTVKVSTYSNHNNLYNYVHDIGIVKVNGWTSDNGLLHTQIVLIDNARSQ